MNRYLQISKVSFSIGFVYRAYFFFSAISNALYIMLTYFLWKAIYKNTDSVLHGMTFQETFLYLAFAAVLFILFRRYLEHEMSDEVISGRIIMNLLKPLDYMKLMFFRQSGFTLFNLLVVTVPTFAVLAILFRHSMHFGYNSIFFILAVCIAYLLSYALDFMTGSIAFYTESTWGIIITKEAIVLFLSGALIPIQFFPSPMQTVIRCLPFRAIYNTPLEILTNAHMGLYDYLSAIGLQCVWLVLMLYLSRAFFNHALKQVTVNGG